MEILSKILMIISEIKKITKGIILEDEPMSQHTSYGIGGKVLAYIRPYDRSDLIRIIKLINKHKAKLYFVGSGSNLLVNDKNISSFVITPAKALKSLNIDKNIIIADEKAMSQKHSPFRTISTLADYINKTPGKELNDVLRGIAYTDKEGDTFFQFKSFWRYLLKTKSWSEKTYPYQKTLRLLESLFGVEEKNIKVESKSVRTLIMETIKLEKPNPRKLKVEEEPWQ